MTTCYIAFWAGTSNVMKCHDDVRYINTDFHGNKQTLEGDKRRRFYRLLKWPLLFERSYDKQNLTLVIISY